MSKGTHMQFRLSRQYSTLFQTRPFSKGDQWLPLMVLKVKGQIHSRELLIKPHFRRHSCFFQLRFIKLKCNSKSAAVSFVSFSCAFDKLGRGPYLTSFGILSSPCNLYPFTFPNLSGQNFHSGRFFSLRSHFFLLYHFLKHARKELSS